MKKGKPVTVVGKRFKAGEIQFESERWAATDYFYTRNKIADEEKRDAFGFYLPTSFFFFKTPYRFFLKEFS